MALLFFTFYLHWRLGWCFSDWKILNISCFEVWLLNLGGGETDSPGLGAGMVLDSAGLGAC